MNRVRGLRNGILVLPDGPVVGGLMIEEGRVVAICENSQISSGQDVIDVGGRVVLPGIVDPEAHLGSSGPLDFDFRTESKAAGAFGVTTWNLQQTTHSVFKSDQPRPESTQELLFSEVAPAFVSIGERSSHCDFTLTPLLTREEQTSEIELLARDWGITSYKIYLHMRAGFTRSWPVSQQLGLQHFDDGLVFLAMREIGNLDGLLSLHCENWEIARVLESELRASGREDLAAWHERSPEYLESMHVRAYAYLANQLGCRLHIQHVSAPSTIRELKRARAEGTRIYGQTALHYLTLNADTWKINVPLRPESFHEPLWKALVDGVIDAVGSDHVGPRRDASGRIISREEMGRGTVWESISGFPSRIEAHLPLLLSEGVSKQRLSIEQLARVACTNPARIWGVYPRKGVIRIGSDADLVVVDLDRVVELKREMVISASGWSIYEGREFKGWPLMTLRRGELVAEWRNGKCWTEENPGGVYLRREPHDQRDS